MSQAFFRILDEDATAGRYASDAATGGPWSPDLQHGGPPTALLVRAAERAAGAERSDLVAMRLAAEFLRPVPVAEVSVTAQVVRAARTVALVEVSLTAGGRACLQARVWLVRSADTAEVAPVLPPAQAEPRDLPGIGADFPYGRAIDWLAVSGSLAEPGPGVTWARPLRGLVSGEPLSGLQRVALIGDSASGISAALDWARWSFQNIDLDVHLARPVSGEWIRIDAVTTVGQEGAALARSTVSDLRGEVGCTAQTLVLAPRS